ncbi:MAG: AraC family transcriptional regulator [Planctomycetota bacterium]
MIRIDQDLSERDIRSPESRQSVVRVDDQDDRSWLLEKPICSALDRLGIAHVGVAYAQSPFEIVRTQLSGAYFLACFGGQGQVLVSGRWQPCGAGQAFLLPAGTLHAFWAERHWDFCWVRYQGRSRTDVVNDSVQTSPIRGSYDVEPLRSAILGLHAECSGEAVEERAQLWVELLDSYLRSFIRPHGIDRRLQSSWDRVSGDLGGEWSVDRMARLAHMSSKHFERLCKRDLGRSPRQHLIWLRMRQAAQLLSETDRTIEFIADAVGYENAFVFSTTFKRVMGWAPSRYPGRQRRRVSPCEPRSLR